RQEIEVEIEWVRKQAQELANGLLPFAITPTMCALVADRLHIEREFEQAVSAQQVLDKKFEQIAREISNPAYWDEFDVALNAETRQRLLSKLETTIKQTAQPPQVDQDEIMLRVSEKDRQSMLGWIDKSATEVPTQFCRMIQRLDHLEKKRKQFDRNIALTPSDEALKPLVETLYEQGRQLGALEITNQDLLTEMERLEHNIEQLENERKRIRHHLDEHASHNRRIHLAIKSQQALEAYTEKLRGEKLGLLAGTIVRRFNHLCRKEDLISGARIDPNSYKITLLRREQTFAREQLSAGEKQLLATAIIWALREISNAPFPVILDTPLGRLDSDHRLSMLDYFPQASHQVILLATDTEIGPELEQRLEPALTRVYDLNELSQPPRLVMLKPANGRVLQPLLINESASTYETEQS
ncbi:MAG: hypothetical protein KDI79_09220, partial [Anaerolineae bacterium]|nr:hypothetical protein [Anaerolineae bacterium]